MLPDNLDIQIKTFFGLEEVLAQEIRTIGGRNIKVKNRAVTCSGDLGFLYKINYSLRTAVKILVPIFTFKAFNEDKFYKKLLKFEWENFMDADQTFAIDTTLHSERFTHSHFMTLKMKDAIVDYFRAKNGRRPSIDTHAPDIKFNLHIDRELVTISLDSSGAPLFKRGYRKMQTEAPMNEVLAAGLLQMAGWDGKGNFLDPMCGSGTLPIEAAMVALNLPAQIFRQEFSFMQWKNYDAALFEKIKETRLNKIRDFEGKITGYDLDVRAIAAARENIKAAELEEVITLERKDFFESKKEQFPLLIVFNPPYDVRIRISEETFYKKIGDTFKNHYPNTLAWLITGDMEAAKQIGLRPSKKVKLYNGKLECRYLQFDIYEGSKKQKHTT